jgi:HK97 family phage portal protein
VARYRDRLLASVSSPVEQRVIGGVPWRPWDSWQWRFDTGGPPHPSRQFLGPDSALALPALYAAVKLIADNIASMPLRTYLSQAGLGLSGKKLWTGPTFFDSPSYYNTMYEWVSMMMVSVLLQGNAWGWVTGRDNYGYPTGIEWIPAQDVYVQEAENEQTWNPMRSKVFVFGREATWHGPDSELFHLRGMPMAGRIEGISPLRSFALTILAGTEAQRYGTDWYAAGGFPPGTFQNAEVEVDKQQAAEMRAELVKSLRRREPLVYGRDWDYKPVTVPPSEAQFLEAMQFNATHIAAIFNVPPDRIGGQRGDSLTYNTVEQSTLQLIEACRPWLVNFEQRASKLILPKNRMCTFYTDALLKTDLEARINMYQIMRNMGLRTINEIRELEDLPPIPGKVGDETLPLTTMNAMGTRAGVIPKSFMPAVVLEMDVATDRLIKLEKYIIPQLAAQGYPVQAAPPSPGGSGGSGSSGGGSFGNPAGSAGTANQGGPTGQVSPVVTVNGRTGIPIGRPNAPLPLAQDPASFLASLITVQRDSSVPYEIRIEAQRMLMAICNREENIRTAHPELAAPMEDTTEYGLTSYNPHRADIRAMVESGPRKINGKDRGHL